MKNSKRLRLGRLASLLSATSARVLTLAVGSWCSACGADPDEGTAAPGSVLSPAVPAGNAGAPPALAAPAEVPLMGASNPGVSEAPAVLGFAGGPGLSPPAMMAPNGESERVAPVCTAGVANGSGYCWSTVAIGGGGFVSGIITSPREQNLIYARTDVGGAYRWNEADQNWIPLTDWVSENETGLLGVESIALDPAEPSRVYMLAGINYFNGGKTAILSSNDYGATFDVRDVTTQFKAHGNGNGRQSGERLAVDPNLGSVLYTGTRANGLFRSTDRGANWNRVTSLNVTTTPDGNGIAFVLFDPNSGMLNGATRVMYVGVSRSGDTNLFVSSDAGATWAALGGEPTTFIPQRAVLAANRMLYVTYGNGAGPQAQTGNPMDRGQVWKLDLASGAWTEITPLRGNANRAFGGISVDAANPNRLLSSTVNTYLRQPWNFGDRIFLSSDGGSSWTDLIGSNQVVMDTDGSPWIEGQAIHWAGSIQIDPFNPARAFVSSGNGVFMTEQLGAARSTWKFAVHGLEEMVPLDAVSVKGSPLVSVIGDYDGFVHDSLSQSPTAGRHLPAIGTTEGVAVAASNPSRAARVGSQLFLSSDGAKTWRQVTRPSNQTGGHLAYSADGNVLVWGADDAGYRTADQGATWAVSTGLGGNSMPVADGANSAKFYAYDPGSGAVRVSTDGGQSFATRATLARTGARRIHSVPGVEGDVWVALNGGGLSRSVDSGASFSRVAGVDSARAVGFGAAAPGRTFPATYIWGAVNGGARGVYRSDDAGASWQRINDDAHEYGGPGNGEFVIGDANTYGRVFMSSAGRGLVMGELAPTALAP